MPLGIWVLEWASAKINAEIFKIVAEEALGYNTVDLGHSATVESGLWGIAGCAEGGTGSTPAANCSLGEGGGAAVVSTSHLNFETWDYYLFSTLAKLRADHAARTPERIGTVGYDGFEANYFPSTVFSRAYYQEGLAMNFYLNYNASWYEPSRFFDSVQAVNATLQNITTIGWEPCQDYAPMNDPDQMRDYVSFFGDSAGAQATDGGQLHGRCLHDVWWVSPACRHNLTLCVPYLTTSGWGIAGIMHKSAAFNMPIAMASIKDFDEWVAVVQATTVMTYWWIPDPSFIDMDMYSCVFPPYDADEHGSGRYTTEFAAVKLEKWAHPELAEAAPLVHATATNMQISMREMQAMLLSQHAGGLTDYSVACTWLRGSNYLGWIPSATDCFVGQGLEDGACVWCPQGTKSEVHATVAGSRQCAPCPAGTYQNQLGQSSCLPCETGTFAPGNGTAACALCPAGRYANATARTACERCGRANEMTMQRMVVKGSLGWEYLQGSRSPTDCVCDRGFRSFEANVSTEAEFSGCRPCGVGMECRGSDDVMIEEGFYSWYDFSIYRCYGDAPACRGGRVGETCQPGRVGLLCARCPSGTHEAEAGGCKACESANALPFVVACVAGGTAMVGIYIGISRENIAKRPKAMSTMVFLFGLVMLSIQQMGVYGTMAVSWDEPVRTVLSVTQLLNFDVEVLDLACVVGQPSPFISYLNKVLVILVLLAGMCVIHFVALAIFKRPIMSQIHTLVAVLGTILVGFLTAMVNIAIIPFECVGHPNGEATVRRYPTVLCGGGEVHGGHGDEYWAMVAVGASSIAAVLSFVACCIFAVEQFPRAMENGDVLYLHRYNFLFARFRPESYWYSLFFILRSLLIAMAPMLPGLFYQILVVIGVQVVALPIIARFTPWRTKAVNLIDCILVMCMIMFNAFAGFFVPDVDTSLVSAFAFAFLVTVFAVLLAGITYAAYTQLSHARKKPFKYFLSHHKGGAGAFARLLKMQLLEDSGRKGLDVFLDCDNLTNLEMLFDFVGSQSGSVVVLMSKELFLRPWCVGELVTAMLRDVPMRPVRFPDFAELTDGFIDKYDSRVDYSCLVPCGIGLDMIQDMLRHIRKLPTLSLAGTVSAAAIRGLARSICSSAEGDSQVRPHRPTERPQCQRVVVIVDHTNWESASTALCLSKCMRRHMVRENNDADRLPDVLGPGEVLPATTEVCIFVLSNGTFMEPPYIKAVLAAEERKLPFLPVIWEDGFRFPSKTMLDDLASVAPVVFAPHGIAADPGRITATVACIFKEIAVVFSPHASNEAILMVQARDIVSRLQSGLQPLDAKDVVETKGEDNSQDGGAGKDEAETDILQGKVTASL